MAVERPVSPADVAAYDFAVSHGYRHIIRQHVLDALPGRLVNLHISLLPWNRGADPNFWSWYEGTPKGVTIHHIDAGIDTGPLLAQREVLFTGRETLASSYAMLQSAITELFRDTWPAIRGGRLQPKPQPSGGSFHRSREFAGLRDQFPLGWDTPVADVVAVGARSRYVHQ